MSPTQTRRIEHRKSMARAFWLLLLTLLTAPALWAQSRISIIVPVRDRDTSDHVDLQVGAFAQLHVLQDSARPVKWHSANSTVASISTKGLVTAKARGYATIRAISGTDTAFTRVCVSSGLTDTLARDTQLHVAAGGVKVILPPSDSGLPPYTFLTQRTFPVTGTAQLKSPGTWGQCVHWTLEIGSDGNATISRRGLVTQVQTGWWYPLATIGPVIP